MLPKLDYWKKYENLAGAEKFDEFLKSNIGSTQEVLIEKRLDKKTGLFKGVTRNYINEILCTKYHNLLYQDL